MSPPPPRYPSATGRPWRRARAAVLARSTLCWLCGHGGADSVDHVIPRSRGGSLLDPSNLRPAHLRCNIQRGNKPAVDTPPPRSRDW